MLIELSRAANSHFFYELTAVKKSERLNPFLLDFSKNNAPRILIDVLNVTGPMTSFRSNLTTLVWFLIGRCHFQFNLQKCRGTRPKCIIYVHGSKGDVYLC